MTSEELLRRYPRETLRWLRRRLEVSQLALALELGTDSKTVVTWETRKHPISPGYRGRLVALLVPHLATPEEAAFVASLGRGEE